MEQKEEKAIEILGNCLGCGGAVIKKEIRMRSYDRRSLTNKEKIRTLSPIYIIDGFQFPNGNLICDECISFVYRRDKDDCNLPKLWSQG